MEEFVSPNRENIIPPPQEVENSAFEAKVRDFLSANPLNLDIPARTETVKILRDSEHQTKMDGFIIANDFPLTAEGAKVTLAYKEGSEVLLAAKETAKTRMDEFAKINDWENLSPEETLLQRGFNDPSILLPVKIIKTEGKVYRFYEAMDMDLEKYLKAHKKMPVAAAVSLCVMIGDAVSKLHENNIIHADILPTNILLRKNALKLIDLDNSGTIHPGNKKSKRSYIGGNRFSMAPELLEERPIFDKTVDVYATSALLFMLIAGDWPYKVERQTKNFAFETKMAEYKKIHQSGKINFPNFIPKAVQRVIRRGMSPLPEDRYQSMHEFMAELMDAAKDQPETKEEVNIEKNLYVINNQNIEQFLKRFVTSEEKIEAVKEILGIFINDEILRKLNFDTTAEEIRNQLEECKDIHDPQEFFKKVYAILKPIDIAREKHPEVFAETQRKVFLENHPTFIPLNEMLLYRIDNGDLHLHLTHVEDFTKEKKIALIKDGLKKLTDIVVSDQTVREISATSWLVANNPNFFTSRGFKIQGEISKEAREEDFEGETRPISRATMSRDKFLEKYKKN